MDLEDLAKINQLWEPLRPYLMEQIRDHYPGTDGHIVEIGPFSGLIFAFARSGVGGTFTIAAFPEEVLLPLRAEAASLDLDRSVAIMPSSPSLHNLEDQTVDLLIFRGALFFPSLFHTDFTALHRVLKPGGIAFVGGGFGNRTPEDLVTRIARTSRELNLALGKTVIEPDQVRTTLAESGLAKKSEVITEGGLWVVLRK